MSNADEPKADTNNVDAIAGNNNELPKQDDDNKAIPEPTNRNEEIVNETDLWNHRLEETGQQDEKNPNSSIWRLAKLST